MVASNIDYIFICMSLNNDFNLCRLGRYAKLGVIKKRPFERFL